MTQVLHFHNLDYDESFSILTDKVIFNYNFLSNLNNNFWIENELEIPNIGQIEYYHQFNSYYSIENNTNLRDHVSNTYQF